ncbi:DUF4160 domain-containing protein [Azospirillum sp.]|uniref:DUF4160 domain-containing protein n=1 Tax=Azospirillum sp. TaxID=34012 RepID=UPI002629EA6D|nr:DUF4160 domain-containing protein [Azospirillum sp.]
MIVGVGRIAGGLMPKVADFGPYRLFFYSNERGEPPHVHVERDGNVAKYWLRPVGLASNDGFAARELRELQRVVVEHERQCEERWHEFFG